MKLTRTSFWSLLLLPLLLVLGAFYLHAAYFESRLDSGKLPWGISEIILLPGEIPVFLVGGMIDFDNFLEQASVCATAYVFWFGAIFSICKAVTVLRNRLQNQGE